MIAIIKLWVIHKSLLESVTRSLDGRTNVAMRTVTYGVTLRIDEDRDTNGGGNEESDSGVRFPFTRVRPPATSGGPYFFRIRISSVGTHGCSLRRDRKVFGLFGS